jgi:predicted acetyltransferase
VEIRDCSAEDLDAALDVRARSFGPLAAENHERWRQMQLRAIGEGRLLAAYEGPDVVATARINVLRQWWFGRAMRLAGIGGVVVAPEYRGRGVGKQLMAAVLRRAEDHGYPLSALYPATAPVYRALGWELAGRQHFVTVPAEALRTLANVTPPVPVRRAGPADVADVMATVARAHERDRDCGPIEWQPSDVAEDLGEDGHFAYLADDGFVGYQWNGSDTLDVDRLVASAEPTLRALWALVGSGSSVVRTVRACVSPTDPLVLLTRDIGVQTDRDIWWMLRVIDAESAFAARGYPPSVEIEVPLTVSDPDVEGNTGRWVLRVEGGRGELRPGVDVGLRLEARGLASLFAGVGVTTLRRAGLAFEGSAADDAALDAALRGPAFMLDYF